MSRLQQRLRRLEAQITDASGLIPHSDAWVGYWADRIDQYLSGKIEIVGRIPLEALDDMSLRAEARRSRSAERPGNLL